MKMNDNKHEIQKAFNNRKTVLGIELGSTRIKAVLIDEDHQPIASGSHEWKNRYENETNNLLLNSYRRSLADFSPSCN